MSAAAIRAGLSQQVESDRVGLIYTVKATNDPDGHWTILYTHSGTASGTKEVEDTQPLGRVHQALHAPMDDVPVSDENAPRKASRLHAYGFMLYVRTIRLRLKSYSNRNVRSPTGSPFIKTWMRYPPLGSSDRIP